MYIILMLSPQKKGNKETKTKEKRVKRKKRGEKSRTKEKCDAFLFFFLPKRRGGPHSEDFSLNIAKGSTYKQELTKNIKSNTKR